MSNQVTIDNAEENILYKYGSAAKVPFSMSREAEDSLFTSRGKSNSSEISNNGTDPNLSDSQRDFPSLQPSIPASVDNKQEGSPKSSAYDAGYQHTGSTQGYTYPYPWPSPYPPIAPPMVPPMGNGMFNWNMNADGIKYIPATSYETFMYQQKLLNDQFKQYRKFYDQRSEDDTTSESAKESNNEQVLPDLDEISNPSEFPRWMRSFKRFLEDNKLGDIIPDRLNESERDATKSEKAFIINSFKTYVKETAYPKSVKDAIKRGHDLFRIILCHVSEDSNLRSAIWRELTTISYDGSADSYYYTSRVKELYSQLKATNSNIPEDIICEYLLKNLHGQYAKIRENHYLEYDLNTIAGISKCVLRTYDRLIKNKKHTSETSPSVTNRHCYKCSSEGHFAPQCPNVKDKLPKPSINSRKEKKSYHRKGIHKIGLTRDTELLGILQNSKKKRPSMTKTPQTGELVEDNQHLLIDSGAAISVIRDPGLLHNINKHPNIGIADAQDREIPISVSGDLQLSFPGTSIIHTEAVASTVPHVDILSLHELQKNGITVDFNNSQVTNNKGKMVARIKKIGPYYWIPAKYIHKPHKKLNVMNVQKQPLFPMEFIHRLLGHVNIKTLRDSIKQGMLTNLSMDDIDWSGYSNFQCEDCVSGKSKKHKHLVGSRLTYQKSYQPFEFLHTDIFGPVPHMPTSSPSYFMAFTDEATRFRWVFGLWNKEAETVTSKFRELVNMVKTQFNTKVRSFQMDRGSEYTNKTIRNFFKEYGIIPCYTSVGDSKANGVAERLNYTLLDDCRTLLRSSNLPLHLWFYAVQFSTLMRNSLITSSVGTSSRAKAGLTGLDVSTILPFGQRVMVNNPPKNKLRPRGIVGFALTPSAESHGYLIYIPSKHTVTDTTNYLIIRGDPHDRTDDADAVIAPLLDQLEARQDGEFDNNMSTHSGGMEMDVSIHSGGTIHQRPVSPTPTADNLSTSSGGNDPIQTGTTDTTEVIPEYIPEGNNDVLGPDIHDDPPEHTSDEIADNIEEHGSNMINEDPRINLQSANHAVTYDDTEGDDQPTQNEPTSNPINDPANDHPSSAIIDNTKTPDPIPDTVSRRTINNDIDPSSAIASTVGIQASAYDDVAPTTEDERTTSSTSTAELDPLPSEEESPAPESTTVATPDSETPESISNVGGNDQSPEVNAKSLEERKNRIFQYRNGDIPRVKPPSTKRKSSLALGEIEDRTQRKRPKRHILYVNAVHSNPTPHIKPSLSYYEAIVNNDDKNDAKGYNEAYMKEYDQLIKMKTWDPNKPVNEKTIPRQQIINSMFIFNTKRDGRKKCRFVARGDQQKAGTYKEDLKANTVHHYALMTSLNIALDKKMFITQLDISSAYLYAELEEDLYIRAPPHMKLKGKAFKLNKSLYGLKQSGANWYKMIGSYLTNSCNMTELTGWPCVFKDENECFVCLFVDDMIVLSKDIKAANKLVKTLKKKFETKVIHDGKLDENNMATYDILGLEIEYTFGKKMTIGMENSLTEKLPHLGFDIEKDNKKFLVPGTPGEHIHKDNLVVEEDDYKEKVKQMQKAIGLLSYVGYKYRFDILYYVNILAQHTLYPSEQVEKLTKQLLNFVWQSKHKKLIWHANKHTKTNRITAITDASFANEEGFRSQLGHYYCLNGKVIGGRSSSEKLRVISSTEAEIYAVSESVPMLQGVACLVKQIDPSSSLRSKILTDSKPTISIVEDQSEDSRAFRNRFFGTRAFRLRDEARRNDLKFEYIKTEDNYADILTKPTSIAIFKKLTHSWVK
ncbi:hypothetical protein HG535_0A08650 [Zygotorulaspora mrakii]|uniref:Gag-Pol-p199 n=1 Tax=Zygotorulaspora mrakii TaxID=42260 RepID=A0A7H9AWX3_ZYGMR|nr:uncharacterized protein HG535_0A08650 [Zygotorulaspora mrakii]QLG70918.1 hypothetical protein HG535_0A08650 [Zygotorulaspora mrakii]